MKRKKEYEHKISGAACFRRGIAAAFTAAVLAFCCPLVSLADSTGTVTVESAKIRSSADTTSNPVGSVTRGKTVTIKDEVTDASGTLWYQVYVDANTTGYVRADLISKEGGGSASTEGGADNDAGQGDAPQGDGQGAASQAQTPMDAQYASVSVEAAKIRSAPSTNDSVVERLTRDTQLVVNGQSNGSSDGKVWYYVTFTGADGAQKTGFVRSDLITLGDMVPVQEEPPAQEEPAESAPEEPVRQDYEVVFKDGEWYLQDNLEGYEQKLQPLLDAGKQQDDSVDDNAKKLVRQRIVIVVLGVLAALFLIVIVIMAIKLRDVYYEDYEDDEDDDEEEDSDDEEEEDREEEAPVSRRRRTGEETGREPERPQRRAVREPETVSRRPAREQAARGGSTEETRVRPAAKRKAKNFMVDDDEFEFEFLNMDDKDI